MSERKREHIELASRSQLPEWTNDRRFYYEPMLASHTSPILKAVNFLPGKMQFPLWVSSMTGGTPQARQINENLAAACREFGLGMGLGSCRVMLDQPGKHMKDFALRPKLGNDLPFFANLGIAQLEKICKTSKWKAVRDMLDMLQADGLTIHVNPLQEWLQPEGDRISRAAIDVIREVLSNLSCPVIVKEVGQGMGPESLKALMKLPVIVEFGAYGGTNFSELELTRSGNGSREKYGELTYLGHTAGEMVDYVNDIISSGKKQECRGVIISGGVKNFLDGYYHISRINFPAIYGQASTLLNYAMKSERELKKYIEGQIEGFNLAGRFLKIRKV